MVMLLAQVPIYCNAQKMKMQHLVKKTTTDFNYCKNDTLFKQLSLNAVFESTMAIFIILKLIGTYLNK